MSNSSSDIDLVKVLDPKLDVVDRLKFACYTGPQNNTYQQFNANSASAGSQSYNIILPSQDTVLSREIIWRNQVTVAITGTPPAYQPLFRVGVDASISNFPAHQAVTVMQCTLNNNSISTNTSDTLAPLLRMLDKRELNRYNGCTPLAYDVYADYADAVGGNNNPNGAFPNSSDNDLNPRGSFAIDQITAYGQVYLPNVPQAPRSGGTLPAGVAVNSMGVPYNTDPNNLVALTCYVTFTSFEPLLMSPFLWGNPKVNCQGMYGLTNLNFVITFGNWNKTFRIAKYRNGNSATCSFVSYGTGLGNIVNPSMFLQQLSMKPEQMKFARNILPYYSLDRYITSNAIPSLAVGETRTFTTNALQLNNIPDAMYIVVRQPLANANCASSDTFLPITKVNITWNNLSGICNSMTTVDLWRASVNNGSNQSWLEYSGVASVPDPVNGANHQVPTAGSVCVLRFGKDIPLVNSFDAPNCIGAYNIIVQVTVANNLPVAQSGLECMLMFQNAGAVVIERGQTSVFQGMLNKSSVLDCISEDNEYNGNDVKRMVGGSFLDNLGSYASRHLPRLARKGLEMIDNPYAKTGADALKNFGVGNGKSGGKLRKHLL